MTYRKRTLSPGEWFEACRRVSIDVDLVWNHYDHLERLETRYASQMERLRLLASTWFLATFAAVGVVLFQDRGSADSTLSVTSSQILAPEWLSFAVLLVGTIGTLLLWTLDALVYRPLLAATFWEAIQMERMSDYLIPVRQQLAHFQGTFGKGVAGLVSYYYFAIIAVQLVGASCSLWLALRRCVVYNFSTVSIHSILTLLLLWLLFRTQQKVFAARSWAALERRDHSES